MSIIPMVTPLAKPPELAFLQTIDNTNNQTSYTFSGANLGAAAADREIIIGVVTRGNTTTRTISSASIGGVTADVRATAGDGGSFDCAFLISANVPTGTTGDVVITFSGGVTKCGLMMYRAIKLKSRTPVDTDTDTDSALQFFSNISKGGFAIAIGLFNSTSSATISGLSDTDRNSLIESNQTAAAASQSGMSEETGRNISLTIGTVDAAGVCCSWR
jgi:hypothetical protein